MFAGSGYHIAVGCLLLRKILDSHVVLLGKFSQIEVEAVYRRTLKIIGGLRGKGGHTFGGEHFHRHIIVSLDVGGA